MAQVDAEVGFVKKIKERLDVHDQYTYEEFIRDWKLFKEGQLGNHDLYCKLVDAFYDKCHQDFLDELKTFFLHSAAAADDTVNSAAGGPFPGQSCCVN
ncbi:hypothetical protein M5689_000668 [Euphorbia peplus]|nr:hypothetical protein M5689_000668 [Euphorbia peplus]